MKKKPAFMRQHPLLMALLFSAAVHLLLVLAPGHDTPAPQPVPVINAELRSAVPRTAQQQQPASKENPPEDAQKSSEKTVKEIRDNIITSKGDNKRTAAPARPAPQESAVTTSPPKTPLPPAAVNPLPATTDKLPPGFEDADDEQNMDPLERSYQQQLKAHLHNHLLADESFNGSVRLELTIQYRQIATNVQVIRSSGNPALDQWAVRATIAANPFPKAPHELPDPYIFRPTIKVGQ